MDIDISRYWQQCFTCHKFKGKAHPLTLLWGYLLLEEPFQHWQFISLPEARNKYTLLITDFAYRICGSMDISRQNNKSNGLQYGTPKAVLMDQGRGYRNKLLRFMAKTWEYDHHLIEAHHSASNGLYERTNQQVLCWQLLNLLESKERHCGQYCLRNAIAASIVWSTINLHFAHHIAVGDTSY